MKKVLGFLALTPLFSLIVYFCYEVWWMFAFFVAVLVIAFVTAWGFDEVFK